MGKLPWWKWDPIKGLSTLGDAGYQWAKPQGDEAVFGGFFVCVVPYTVHSHYDMETATIFALQTTSEPGVSSSLMSPDTGDSGARAQNKRSVFPAATIKRYCY